MLDRGHAASGPRCVDQRCEFLENIMKRASRARGEGLTQANRRLTVATLEVDKRGLTGRNRPAREIKAD